jgi:hypothetical protein
MRLISWSSGLAALFFASSAFAVEPLPGQAAAAAPSNSPIAITATCSLGDHPGVDEAEAKTAADIICHDLAKRGATNTSHEVRFGKLGGRTLVTLASRSGNEYDESRTFINGLDEIDVAGPRLVASLVEGKPMNETRTVDNVLANEQRAPKQAQGSVFCTMAMYGQSSLGEASAASGGFDLGIGYRAGRLGLSADGRLGGVGSSDNKISGGSLDVGGRFYITDSDVSPFVGGGFELSYTNISQPYGGTYNGDLSGSGAGAFGTVGVEMLRTHHMGFVAAGRIDTPFYSLDGQRSVTSANANSDYASRKVSTYAMPISLTVGLIFH